MSDGSKGRVATAYVCLGPHLFLALRATALPGAADQLVVPMPPLVPYSAKKCAAAADRHRRQGPNM